MESQPALVAAAKSQSGIPSTPRLLVIRVEISSQGPSRSAARLRLGRGALLLIAGALAVLLGWIGITVFRPEPPSAPAAVETRPAEAASPSFISEVVPEVPPRALATIRGTIRVAVRVVVGKDGKVLAATAQHRGPSRYFERLAIEASRKWTFAPTDLEEERIMLVRFSFTRAGTTASANSLQ